jgi:CelD/BcsL family acetyltransferase involved in cellulose biosynthesis
VAAQGEDASSPVLRTIHDLAGIAEVEGDWRRLAEARGNAFLSPEWFSCWFEEYGDTARPLVAVLPGEAGSVRGLMAFALPVSGRPRICRIAGANLGDCFSPVAVAGEELAVAVAAGEALRDASDPWSVIALDHVEEADAWIDGLEEGLGVRMKRHSRSSVGLPWIDLSLHGGWDGYLAARSSHLRKRLRQLDRRQARDHDVRVRQTERADQVSTDIATFFELHDRRWAGRGGSSLDSDRARAFHGRFAEAAQQRGWLRLWFLEFDGNPVAAWYGWRLGRRYSFYNGGFDPSFSSLSPGLVLLATVIESAFEEGAAEFDFLLGDEGYKQRFAEEERTVSDVSLARSLPHPAGAITGAQFAARRLARKLSGSTRQRLGLDRLARRRRMRGR